MAEVKFGFGRKFSPDSRDHLFRVAPLLDQADVMLKSVRYSMFSKPLDQGATGTCVGFGWKHLLLLTPRVQGKPDVEPTAKTIYHEATHLDEWDDNDDDEQAGTSVRAGAKALQARGLLGSYFWEFEDVQNILRFLVLHADTPKPVRGPVVMGTNWYNSMFDVSNEGIIKVDPSSGIAGGHCWVIDAYDHERGLVDCLCAWRGWGRKLARGGPSQRAWVPLDGIRTLLDEAGEACFPTEPARA